MSKPTPLYSTASGDQRKARPASPAKGQGSPGQGPAKMRLETKGRGGKSVTVLFNLPYDTATARTLMKELQEACGCGATYKDGCIELQGDRRERIEAHFAARGEKLVRAGG